MTVEEIRREKQLLMDELAEAQGRIEIARAKLKVLHAKCQHPNLRKYSAMGELGDICDDCGYQT